MQHNQFNTRLFIKPTIDTWELKKDKGTDNVLS